MARINFDAPFSFPFLQYSERKKVRNLMFKHEEDKRRARQAEQKLPSKSANTAELSKLENKVKSIHLMLDTIMPSVPEVGKTIFPFFRA